MSDVPVPSYYSQYTAKERSYIEYIGEINKSISSEIESNSNRQIAASALFAGEIKSTLIDNQIATENALYNYTQQLDGSLMNVSRQLGDMGSKMSMGLAYLNSTVQESSKAICKKMDDINKTLENPLCTQARELYNRALQSYAKGFYEEALKDLHESINKNETDPFSHFLLGQTYLFGIGEDSNVIDLNASIESLRNAAKYITP
ncbi:tetratricopeptide repeat protein, partial [Treponema sp. R80B11-R83G3]